MANGLSRVAWTKSSYSKNGLDRAECVEVAPNLGEGVGIRDSKDTSGPALLVSRKSFANSVRALKGQQR